MKMYEECPCAFGLFPLRLRMPNRWCSHLLQHIRAVFGSESLNFRIGSNRYSAVCPSHSPTPQEWTSTASINYLLFIPLSSSSILEPHQCAFMDACRPSAAFRLLLGCYLSFSFPSTLSFLFKSFLLGGIFWHTLYLFLNISTFVFFLFFSPYYTFLYLVHLYLL